MSQPPTCKRRLSLRTLLIGVTLVAVVGGPRPHLAATSTTSLRKVRSDEYHVAADL